MRNLILALLIVLPVAACKTISGDATPRQQAAEVDTSYAVVQVLALTALESDQLSADVEARIKLAESAATESVLAFHDASVRCEQQPDGSIGDAASNPPGVHCDASLIGLTKGAAVALINNLDKLLAAAGFEG